MRVARAPRLIWWCSAAGIATLDGYLLLLVVAAAQAGWRPGSAGSTPSPRQPGRRHLVLVPAHDEEAIIGECLETLTRLDAPSTRPEVVVVADNCSDATADIARAYGARVLERRDTERRGKGHALNWALDELRSGVDAVTIVDADCKAERNLLLEAEAALDRGADVTQARYLVSNADSGSAAALRRAAFILVNEVRPRGRVTLGASAGLMGTGMTFRRAVLEEFRFDPASLVEDADLHLRLVLSGYRVVYLERTAVSSAMPTDPVAVAQQQERWEGGRSAILKQHFRALLSRAVRRRDKVAAVAAMELVVPPTSILTLAHLAVGAPAALLGRHAAAIAVGASASHIAFVLGGLRVAGAPSSVYCDLLRAPALVMQKVALTVRLAQSGAPEHWERTARPDGDGRPTP